MKNHESLEYRDDFGANENFAKPETYDQEKARKYIYMAWLNATRVLSDLTWRVPSGSAREHYSPRERYDTEHHKELIDRARVFSEVKILHDYTQPGDYNHKKHKEKNDISGSMFLRYFGDEKFAQEVSLPEEIDHFNNSVNDFADHFRNLLVGDKRDRSFANYLESLIKMCENVYGKGSHAEMYLCDDLNRILSSEKNKTEVIDRLIMRKIDAAARIAMDEAIDRQGLVLVGFTGTLDLPEGTEDRSVKELVEEGVPSLYGYGKE